MVPGIRQLPPSRRNKRQVLGWLDAPLVEAIHKYRHRRNLTAQEIVAEAVNRAVAQFGRKPILQVSRDRYVRRQKAVSQVQSDENVPSRNGKRRLAAWFDQKDVENLFSFKSEVGTKVELLLEIGVKKILEEDRAA